MCLPIPTYPESEVRTLFCSKNSFLSTETSSVDTVVIYHGFRLSLSCLYCLQMTDGIVNAKNLRGFKSSHTAIYREESLPVGQLPAPTNRPWAPSKVLSSSHLILMKTQGGSKGLVPASFSHATWLLHSSETPRVGIQKRPEIMQATVCPKSHLYWF